MNTEPPVTPPPNEYQNQNQVNEPSEPQYYANNTVITKPTMPKSRKLLIIVAFVLLLLSLGVGAFLVFGKDSRKDSASNAGTDSSHTEVKQETSDDKQGIQMAVNQYCKDFGKALGFSGMNSGYIITDRFSEEVLGDSPFLLRFKQVGNAASATVDCENSQGPIGISNDLLFVKQDGAWTYVDEVQNNAGTGFICSVVEKHGVSKELVSSCAASEGAKVQQR